MSVNVIEYQKQGLAVLKSPETSADEKVEALESLSELCETIDAACGECFHGFHHDQS